MSTSAHYLRPRGPRAFALWLVAIAMLAAVFVLGQRSLERKRAVYLLLDQNALLEAAQRQVARPKPSSDDIERQRHWTALRSERSFPWVKVFDAVERADRSNIELLAFTPEKANRNIVLRGEAQDREALTAYMEALASQPSLSQLHLLHFQTMKHEKISTVSFEIKAAIR